ncbi:MAG TPA: hemerythrin domain-containing protein [Caulobacteraceae bacterium]|nr:hemerythrin domain-containing protein [Caulobacteraceae bacterium]
MASTQKSKSGGSKSSTTKKASQKATSNDAIKLLEADHRQVEKWFKEFEATNGEKTKTRLVEQICLALKVHTQIEEEIFYPASREAFSSDQEEMVDEAVVEHASAKNLIAEIEAMEVGDDLFDAKVHVLMEVIEHHVEEEEKEYFPAARKTDMDMEALGMQMAERKEQLMGQMTRVNGHMIQ